MRNTLISRCTKLGEAPCEDKSAFDEDRRHTISQSQQHLKNTDTNSNYAFVGDAATMKWKNEAKMLSGRFDVRGCSAHLSMCVRVNGNESFLWIKDISLRDEKLGRWCRACGALGSSHELELQKLFKLRNEVLRHRRIVCDGQKFALYSHFLRLARTLASKGVCVCGPGSSVAEGILLISFNEWFLRVKQDNY